MRLRSIWAKTVILNLPSLRKIMGVSRWLLPRGKPQEQSILRFFTIGFGSILEMIPISDRQDRV